MSNDQSFHIKDQMNAKRLADLKIRELPTFTHSFFNHLRADNYSEKTIMNYACDLKSFFDFLVSANPALLSVKDITPEALDKLTYEDLDEYKIYSSYVRDNEGQLLRQSEPATIHRKLGTLRSFFKFCHGRHLIQQNTMLYVTNPKKKEKAITYLEPDEIMSMLDEIAEGNHLTKRQRKYCSHSYQRDYAIVLTLVSTGLRVSELVGIDIQNIDFKNQALYVHRKGNKEQNVYFSDDVCDALQDYINGERASMHPDHDALFLSNRGTRITVRSVERIVGKYTQSPDVTVKHITPHKLRSTFGTNLYRETGDIYLTADALNHKDISVTAKHYSAQSEVNRQKIKDIRFVGK